MARHLPLLDAPLASDGGLAADAAPEASTHPTPPWSLGAEAERREAHAVDGGELLLVGDLAKAAGKTVRAIHLYEEVGLLRPSARSKGRYRLYERGALGRLRWIGKMSDLGLSLAQIQELVRGWEASPSAPFAMAGVRATYTAKLDETRQQIARLRELERELVESLAYLDSCTPCDPHEELHACAACTKHSEEQPELIAGVHAPRPPAPPTPFAHQDSDPPSTTLAGLDVRAAGSARSALSAHTARTARTARTAPSKDA
jgi:MerR family copper efflux transcriptional regulator